MASAAPIPIIIVILFAGIITDLITGESTAAQLWPADAFFEGDDFIDVATISYSDCNSNESSGFFSDVQDAVCFVGNIFKAISNAFISFINIIGDVLSFGANVGLVAIAVFEVLVSFFTWDIPGIPEVLRVILTTLTGLVLMMGIYDMARGRG